VKGEINGAILRKRKEPAGKSFITNNAVEETENDCVVVCDYVQNKIKRITKKQTTWGKRQLEEGGVNL